jgi:hypothetical protein
MTAEFVKSVSIQVKRYSNPITGLDRPLGFQEVEAPRFLDNRQRKVVRLSALCTGRLYPPGNIPGTVSVRGWVDPRAIVRPKGLCQWKIPMTPFEMKPATFRLVVQCLNQLRHRIPRTIHIHTSLTESAILYSFVWNLPEDGHAGAKACRRHIVKWQMVDYSWLWNCGIKCCIKTILKNIQCITCSLKLVFWLHLLLTTDVLRTALFQFGALFKTKEAFRGFLKKYLVSKV